MGDEHHIHVEDFHDRTHKKSIDCGRLLSLEQVKIHGSRHEAREARGYTAGDPGVTADPPEGTGYIALNTANQPGNDAGDGIEKSPAERGPRSRTFSIIWL